MKCWLALALCGQVVPQNGDTIVFVGDSITQAGDYVAYVEWALAGRSNIELRIVNSGLSSETVSGTSEPDHRPPRPCIHTRFERDVVAHKPNLVVACYGMNDGNYHPFDEARFAKYQAGMRRLVERVFRETPARGLAILTPPPFDATRVKTAPPGARMFGYKTPAADYDATLLRYSQWLPTLASDKVKVVDLHAMCVRHLEAERRKTPDYHLAGDGVHPGATGHWLMATAVLEAFGVADPPSRQDDDPLFKLILKRRRHITQHWLAAVRKRSGVGEGAKAVAEGEAETAKHAAEIARLRSSKSKP